jgi:hypothetical protein
MDLGEIGMEVDAAGSESCPVDINISGVEYLNSAVLSQVLIRNRCYSSGILQINHIMCKIKSKH